MSQKIFKKAAEMLNNQTGILLTEELKKEDTALEESKYVQDFGLDNFNSGCTLVRLVESIDKKAKKCYNTRHNSKGDRV